jgi:G3E family GTPase
MLGPKLLRLKGLVAMADDPERPMLIHAVQSVADPPVRLPRWPSRDRRTRLVVIAQGEVRRTIEGFWKALTNTSGT